MFFNHLASGHELPEDCEYHWSNLPDIILLAICILYLVAFTGTICHLLVSALEVLAKKLKLSDSVAGASLLAAASASPEFFTSLISVFGPESELGTATVIGSVVFNGLIGMFSLFIQHLHYESVQLHLLLRNFYE
ncbi:hypothetical protein RCL1_000055 [Eukaryota sp. TZLM3-RCL]